MRPCGTGGPEGRPSGGLPVGEVGIEGGLPGGQCAASCLWGARRETVYSYHRTSAAIIATLHEQVAKTRLATIDSAQNLIQPVAGYGGDGSGQ